MIDVTDFTTTDTPAWQAYVENHSEAAVTHDIRWREVIASTLGHLPVYLLARDGSAIVGVLPLFLTRTWWGKKYL
ncbi:MAG: hypothetical protein D6800_10015, partial [Candidatus Zixiibacteriota bacterium]